MRYQNKHCDKTLYKSHVWICSCVLVLLFGCCGIFPSAIAKPLFVKKIDQNIDVIKYNIVPHKSFGVPRAIGQSKDGTIWAALETGILYIQDSNTWHMVPIPDKRRIADAVQAPNGDFWVGTYRDGIGHLHDGKWQWFNKENSGLPFNEVRALSITDSGTLWASSYSDHISPYTSEYRKYGDEFGGLVRFYKGNWQFINTKNSNFPCTFVTSIVMDNQGALWVSCLDDLVRIQDDNMQVLTDKMPGYSFNAVAQGSDNAVWIGTYKSLARVYDGNWKIYTLNNSKLTGPIDALAAGNEGAIWIATNETTGSIAKNGITEFNNGKWKIINHKNSDLPKGKITAIFQDSDGNLWAGGFGWVAVIRH